MPWANFTDNYETSNPHGYYTNYELMEYFHPANPTLPFIFDSFDWSHCENWDEALLDGELGTLKRRLDLEDMPVWKRRHVEFRKAYYARAAAAPAGEEQQRSQS